ncbi:MAG: protein NosL [Gammaproteobacteria bacterium]|nr:MAG: protein NosL [Gammaproteobacteria bacterium]
MKRIFIILSAFFLLSCSEVPESGPVEVKWDRDICVRCKMALSDHYHSAQIRISKHKVHKFDDIGDAVLWLQENKKIKSNPNFEIWVNDHETAKWIDAKKAFYIKENHTPMEFGFSASTKETKNTINYQKMIEGIIAKEAYNLKRAREEYQKRQKLLKDKK